MDPIRQVPGWRERVLASSVRGLAALVFAAALSVQASQNPAPAQKAKSGSPSQINEQAASSSTGKQNPRKTSLEKTRDDAAELSEVADQLRDELNKMDVNVLSLDVIRKTEKVEELAKKIKGESHGN